MWEGHMGGLPWGLTIKIQSCNFEPPMWGRQKGICSNLFRILLICSDFSFRFVLLVFGNTPICSDLLWFLFDLFRWLFRTNQISFRFPRSLPICSNLRSSIVDRTAPICSDSLWFVSICSDLLCERIRTNQGDTFLPKPFVEVQIIAKSHRI